MNSITTYLGDRMILKIKKVQRERIDFDIDPIELFAAVELESKKRKVPEHIMVALRTLRRFL